MARQAGVPVVPIAIKYSDVLMGKGTGEAKWGTLEMVFMPPVETVEMVTDEDVNRLIAGVRKSIADELELSLNHKDTKTRIGVVPSCLCGKKLRDEIVNQSSCDPYRDSVLHQRLEYSLSRCRFSSLAQRCLSIESLREYHLTVFIHNHLNGDLTGGFNPSLPLPYRSVLVVKRLWNSTHRLRQVSPRHSPNHQEPRSRRSQ